MKRPPWVLVAVERGRGVVTRDVELWQVCERPAAVGVLHLPGRPALWLRPLVAREGET